MDRVAIGSLLSSQEGSVSSFGCRLDHDSEPAERVAFSDKLKSLRGINQTPKRGEGMKAVRFHQLGGPDVLKLEEVKGPDLHDAEALAKIRRHTPRARCRTPQL